MVSVSTNILQSQVWYTLDRRHDFSFQVFKNQPRRGDIVLRPILRHKN